MVRHLMDNLFKEFFALRLFEELDGRARERRMRGNEEAPRYCGIAHYLVDILAACHGFVNIRAAIFAVRGAEARRSIRLRVEINHQNPPAIQSQIRSEDYRCR